MNMDEVFKKLKPIMGKRIDSIWREYLIADPTTKKMIEDSLRLTLASKLNHSFEGREILLEPPSKEQALGKYPLGMIHYGRKPFHQFGLRDDEFIQHLGIFGRSGSGKTNIAYLIILNLLRKNKPFLIFDWKRNYRDLLPQVKEKDVLIYTVGRKVAPFYFNPLIPPKGTPATVWLKKLIDIMCHAYFLGEGVAYLMQKAIDTVYQKYKVYDGEPAKWPTLDDVKSWLEDQKVKAKEALWMQSALRAVGVLCFGEVGRVLNSQKPIDFKDLLEKNVILELDALTSSDKTFLIEALLIWIHHYRLAQQEKEQFKHAIIIEEAHHILLRKKQEITGEESVTDVIIREIRELGEGLILIDQHPSLISIPALANTYCTIGMNLKHRADLNTISSAMNLEAEQVKYLGILDIGWGMVKLQGRWPKPFLVRFPLIRIHKGSVTDKDLSHRQSQVAPLEQVLLEGRELVKGLENDFRVLSKKGRKEVSTGREGISGVSTTSKRDSTVSASRGKNRNKREEKCAINLTTKQMRFLEDVKDNEYDNISERYFRLGFNWREGNIIRSYLINNSFISLHNISTGKARIKILKLTKRGREVFGIDNNDESNRRGGIEHRYWIHNVAEHYRKQGFVVEVEKPVNGGKTVDVVATKNGKQIAIEVETGKSDALVNVEKCLEAGFDEVVVVAVSNRVREALEEIVEERYQGDSRVVVMSVPVFCD